MRRFASKLLSPFNDLRVRAPSLRPRTPTTDENAEEGHDRDAQGGAITQVSNRKTRLKPSARQRLAGFSSVRIDPTAIEFTSFDSQKSGGKADVAQATYRWGNGDEEQVVAVKKVRYHRDMKKKKFENEFVHEVEVMAGLSHENIVRLIGFVEDFENGKAWIVLSWEPNGNVSEFLAKGDCEIPERVSLIQDTFEGIKYLHTRQPPICHGDLKSFNILVSPSYRAVITDFGSARAISAPEDEALGNDSGQQGPGSPTTEQACAPIHVAAADNQLTLTGPAWSLRWAAPEVMNGKRPGLSSDIWAAGWVCWEMMTDKVPFPELNATGVITLTVTQGAVPSPREDGQLGQIVALCSMMTDCWAFDPKARPSIARCCNELQWMPSVPPSDGKASSSKGPSIELLIKQGQMLYKQNNDENASSVLQQALSLAKSTGNQRPTADALRWLGHVYRAQCKYTQAEESYTRAQEIYARIGNDQGRANVLHGLGEVYCVQSKYTQAEKSYTQAQEIFARIGDDLGRANALRGLGELYRVQSKYTQAAESYAQAQEIYARIGSGMGRAYTLDGLGKVYRAQSKYTEAEESLTRAHEIHARIGNDQGRADALDGLGDVYRLQSKYTEAEQSYTRAQEIYARIGNDLGRANTLRGIGHLRRSQGRNVEAAAHYTEAKDLYAQIGRTVDVEAVSRWLAVVLPDQHSSTTSG
ncbi:hypothetical protein M407DRAFT_26580 [Tulasnella calospora MUT 4182]|uniref:Protein kinase domain-containing protein n=1 Tax=Tulasnella calospora MUT 4182 TaxID=1051891 RepID=A0A0C3KRB5_9AGAM|nr:hypothetical protein M407DRAFT_26580 [Tulasnella calospora MUT 4182]